MSGFKFSFLPDAATPSSHAEPKDERLTDSTSAIQSEACELAFTDQIQHTDLESIALSSDCKLWKGRLSSQVASQLLNSEELNASDLVPGQYEGGFKLWECAVDLAVYLYETWKVTVTQDGSICSNLNDLAGRRVLELGCGTGLPGILAALLGLEVHFQDFNPEVLTHSTMPNLVANLRKVPEALRHCLPASRFFHGSWAQLPSLLNELGILESYDYILSTDTIYNLDTLPDLLACILKALKPGGTAYIAAKSYYFGVGGSTRAFKELLQACPELLVESGRHFTDGSSNVREILLLHKATA